jgi:hypothetical protein
MTSDLPTPRRVRLLPTEDLPGSVRQSLGDLQSVSAQLDAGHVPGLGTASMLERIADELRGAAAIAGGYHSGYIA